MIEICKTTSIKNLRQRIDKEIKWIIEERCKAGIIHQTTDYLTARDQVEIKLIEAKMWAGKMLEGMGNKLPEEYRDEAKEDCDLDCKVEEGEEDEQ